MTTTVVHAHDYSTGRTLCGLDPTNPNGMDPLGRGWALTTYMPDVTCPVCAPPSWMADLCDAVPEWDEPPLCACGRHYVGAPCPRTSR